VGDTATQAAHRAVLEARFPGSFVLSARNPDDVARLRAHLVEHFTAGMIESELRLGWHEQHLRGAIFERCVVLDERYDEDGVVLRVKAPPGFRVGEVAAAALAGGGDAAVASDRAGDGEAAGGGEL
jgi:GTP-binding protein HflX